LRSGDEVCTLVAKEVETSADKYIEKSGGLRAKRRARRYSKK
jgi:hypothetical protein